MMRAALIGTVESTRVAIAAFSRNHWELALLVTLPVEAAGRHSDYVDLSGEMADGLAQVHFCRQINDASTIAAIQAADVDYVFVIGWSQLCGAHFLDSFQGKLIGYHPAPLPRLRGRAVIPWTILLDEPITAASLFWLDAGVDSGALLAQKFFHVSSNDTATTLYEKHMAALAHVLDIVLPDLSAGRVLSQAQDEEYATYAARRRPEDGIIDWNQAAITIHRLIRAVTRPYPGARTTLGMHAMQVWRSSLPTRQICVHALPGQVVAIGNDRLTVQTGSGLICLEEWELSGGAAPAMHAILGGAI
jgi:methionyl-tRNA formyltransferase